MQNSYISDTAYAESAAYDAKRKADQLESRVKQLEAIFQAIQAATAPKLPVITLSIQQVDRAIAECYRDGQLNTGELTAALNYMANQQIHYTGH